MKNLKIFSLVLLFFAAFTFVACEGDNDELTGSASVGGLLTSASPAITYALGSSPTAQQTATVSLFQGAVKTTSIEVYKQFIDAAGLKSANVLYKTLTFPLTSQMETVDFTFSYAELIAGLSINGVALPASDATLVAGSYWNLTYLSKTSEGNEHLNVKSTRVNVACVSLLAGNYRTSTYRPSNGNTYTFALEVLDQVADGQYNTTYAGQYYGAGQTPGSGGTALLAATTDAGFTFTDICNNLQVETQNLGSAYINEIRQTPAQRALSMRDPATGILKIYYSVWFTNNTVEREYVTTMTPIP